MIKKDNWFLGFLIGVSLPVLVVALLYFVFYIIGIEGLDNLILKPKKTSLISIFFNMITFRYYMVNLKFDKTGGGILIITIIYVIYFFAHIS